MPKKKKHTIIDKLSERFHILLVNEKTLEKKKLISSSTFNLAVTSFMISSSSISFFSFDIFHTIKRIF